MKVTVLEKTSKFKRFGGPIQLASNAMQVLKSLDADMFSAIEAKATFTGNLKNGIKDGIRDEWYAMFDLKTPAEERNMPFTCVVERPDLQEILLGRLADGVVQNAAGVASYTQEAGGPVSITLEDGFKTEADVLIGADGIWSAVRSTMHNNPVRGDESGATYSGYTVHALTAATYYDAHQFRWSLIQMKKKSVMAIFTNLLFITRAPPGLRRRTRLQLSGQRRGWVQGLHWPVAVLRHH